ncbi:MULTISPECIES: sugar ABC transporter permease [unclassified Thermoanaerobacterium]|uniref:carbohydrate ABC transporter permease n=1 Tax=unclassified Thermoanaerobacterium TaxID=2622527 RepID=UPI000A155852|nr:MULTISPECIES: sugar ABC transporter permease [unclassified Thermoanaerobacterium]MDE4541434.1 sugar ABC transporter permease [Thermoanaerobacterium sp. R66]ORX23039.1 ABC transporter permease [Thermoanaerobacterium sp. PSU-2]HHV73149.1 sugar ABC transporter permease [Thermoanaerobacterium sp.]
MKKNSNTLTFWLFLIPSLFIFINVVIIPFILGIIYSFTDWDGFSFFGSKFVAFSNYLKVFRDQNFLSAFLLTFKYAIIMVIVSNIIGFSLALLVTRKMKTRNILRSIFFMPNLIGGLILGFIWQFIFTKLFVQLGTVLHASNIFFNWINDPNMAFWSIVIVSAWQMSGYVMIIYIAGLESINPDIIEASLIDGAGPVRRLFNIILPLTVPSFTISLFITLSNSFKQYDTNLSLTNGGPYGTTELLTMNIVQTAYKHNQYAIAQSKAVVFFVVIMAITLVQVYLTKKREVEM